jgi:hypothetical protein
MPYCTKCGAELPSDATFCPKCGTPVTPPTPPPAAAPPPKTPFTGRMIRAMKLDSALYEEVEIDPIASRQVFIVIVLTSICSSIGSGLLAVLTGEQLSGVLTGFIGGFIVTIIGLIIWSYLVYIIGTKLFGGKATPQETWRCAGFAYSPGVISIIPGIGVVIAAIWIIAAQIVAARQALDITTGKSVATCIISFIPYAVLHSLVAAAIAMLI